MSEVKLLPLPEGEAIGWSQAWSHDQMHDYARANMEPLIAENERLRAEVEKWEAPCREFLDKTQWVKDTAKPRELGLHRADVLRQRIEQAEARAERLEEALRHTKEKLEHVAAIRGGHGTFAGTYLIVTEALDQEGGNG